MEQKNNTFGELLKSLRMNAKLSLREFAKKTEDDSANVSRIERALRSAPGDDIIQKYAKALGLVEPQQNWQDFMDLAALSRREIPHDIASDAELVAKLPALLRTIRATKPTEDELEAAVEIAHKAFKP